MMLHLELAHEGLHAQWEVALRQGRQGRQVHSTMTQGCALVVCGAEVPACVFHTRVCVYVCVQVRAHVYAGVFARAHACV